MLDFTLFTGHRKRKFYVVMAWFGSNMVRVDINVDIKQLISCLRNSRPPYSKMSSNSSSNNKLQILTASWMGSILYLRSNMCHHHLRLFQHPPRQRGICRTWSAMQKPKKLRSVKMLLGVYSLGIFGWWW